MTLLTVIVPVDASARAPLYRSVVRNYGRRSRLESSASPRSCEPPPGSYAEIRCSGGKVDRSERGPKAPDHAVVGGRPHPSRGLPERDPDVEVERHEQARTQDAGDAIPPWLAHHELAMRLPAERLEHPGRCELLTRVRHRLSLCRCVPEHAIDDLTNIAAAFVEQNEIVALADPVEAALRHVGQRVREPGPLDTRAPVHSELRFITMQRAAWSVAEIQIHPGDDDRVKVHRVA